ncbi:MAG: hypothetical protein EOP14_04550 [Pseudomonas sp.]|nr:MAG: hypothetical protein EOP14_04550 [Pseudomonas sp.]
MSTLQLSVSLDHIDNQELARLAELWRSQASSGHAEARNIASSFAAEQRRRLEKGFMAISTAKIDQSPCQEKNFLHHKILIAIKSINTVLRSMHSRLN